MQYRCRGLGDASNNIRFVPDTISFFPFRNSAICSFLRDEMMRNISSWVLFVFHVKLWSRSNCWNVLDTHKFNSLSISVVYWTDTPCMLWTHRAPPSNSRMRRSGHIRYEQSVENYKRLNSVTTALCSTHLPTKLIFEVYTKMAAHTLGHRITAETKPVDLKRIALLFWNSVQ